ncbi:MAG: hypothetical protein ACRDMX_06050, partial [Solirubrobacteraceae bacterium]
SPGRSDNRPAADHPAGAYSCPEWSPSSPMATLTVRHKTRGPALASASQLAAATEPTTPCDPMSLTIRRRRRTPLLGGAGVVHAVQAMLGIRLQRAG